VSDVTSALDARRLRAVIVDVDGTLYRQGPVRRAMLWRLVRAYLGAPRAGIVSLRALRAYRRAQEALREGREEIPDLAAAQIQHACRASGVPGERIAACVARWIEDEPLALVARCRRDGVADFLRAAKGRGLRLGVFSDYPPAQKLAALGLAGLFDVAVCAQDPEVRRFKPHPRGLVVTARHLGVDPAQAVYIGDRPDTDAVAARAAGMACAILGGRRPRTGEAWTPVAGYPALAEAIRAV
jgi:HAD superfamily hydrolase (TIGR01509 family)